MKRYSKSVFAVLVVLLLGACSMDADTYYNNDHRMELHSSVYENTVETASLTGDAMTIHGREYMDHGVGPVYVDVAYDPASPKNCAMSAAKHAASLKDRFVRKGMPVESVGIYPVEGLGDVSKATIRYKYMSVKAPDCELMGGVESRDVKPGYKYEYGCTRQTYMARQVASPKDLAGGPDEMSVSRGRAGTNIIEGYSAGETLGTLTGESVN